MSSIREKVPLSSGVLIPESLQSQPMIIYDLVCEHGHSFEGWFDGADDYEKQHRSGVLECPVCGHAEVHKILSTSHISIKRNSGALAEQGRRNELLQRMHEHVERNYENVGGKFAEEARKMHYGEREQRNIRGEATPVEYESLRDEGITALPLPPGSVPREKLN